LSALIWEYSRHTATRLLCELALADWCNDEGICWPSMEVLASRMRVKVRNAQIIVSQLQGLGDLYRAQARGRSHSNRFVLLIALSPEQARHTLKKWFALSDPDIDVLLQKVQWDASFLAGAPAASANDPFVAALHETQQMAHAHGEKGREIAPRTIRNHQEPSDPSDPSGTSSSSKRNSFHKGKPAAATATAFEKQRADELDQIFGIENPTATELAMLQHMTDDYLKPWIKFKYASNKARAEVGKEALGPGFYVQQFRNATVAPMPPITLDDLKPLQTGRTDTQDTDNSSYETTLRW
jgi:hypothetical protein